MLNYETWKNTKKNFSNYIRFVRKIREIIEKYQFFTKVPAVWIKMYRFEQKIGPNLFIYKNIVDQS